MEIKYPKIGGIEQLAEEIKALRNRNPSEKFINIINENSVLIDEEDHVEDLNKSNDQAARPPEASA